MSAARDSLLSKAHIQELNHRREDGIEVTLLFNNKTSEISVLVTDERADHTDHITVPAARRATRSSTPTSTCRMRRPYDRGLPQVVVGRLGARLDRGHAVPHRPRRRPLHGAELMARALRTRNNRNRVSPRNNRDNRNDRPGTGQKGGRRAR